MTDQQGGLLPGVVVTAIPADRRPRLSTTTDGAGFYALKELPPGKYTIKAELPGFATVLQPALFARAGVSLSLNLVLTVGDVGETVTVRRDAPLLESKSATTSVNIAGELQRALPLSARRNWSDFLMLVPGAASSEIDAGGDNQLFSVNGADFASHVIQIDGADMASAIQNSNFYLGLNTDAIADVNIRTAGVDASAPLGQGAIINVVTQSGSNQLHGDASLMFQPMQWNARNAPGGTSPGARLLQPDVSVGGALIEDVLWAFGSYRYIEASRQLDRSADEMRTLAVLTPGFTPFDLESSSNYYFGKLTAQRNRHRLQGFYQYDLRPFTRASAISTAPTRMTYGGQGVSANLNSTWSSELLTRVTVSYNDKSNSSPAISDTEPSRVIYLQSIASGGSRTGVTPLIRTGAPSQSWAERPYSKVTAAVDATWYPQVLGTSHEFQTGVLLQPRLHQEIQTHWVNQGFVLEELVLSDPSDLTSVQVPFHRRFRPEGGPTTLGNTSDMAGYVQGLVRPTSRLTVTLGIRADYIRSTDDLFDVHTQSSLDIGPRLGATLALDDRRNHIMRLTWGRVHEKPSATAAGSVTFTADDRYDTNLDGTFDRTLITPGSRALAAGRRIDPDLHQPRVDEWTVGYRSQLPGNVAFDASYLRREFRDRLTSVEINGLYDGQRFIGYADETQNAIALVTNNVWNWPVYSALSVAVTRTSNGLQFIGSFTHRWQHLAGTWQPHDPASFIQPEAFPNSRGIGSTRGLSTDGDSLSGDSMVLTAFSPQARDAFARLGLSWSGPYGITLATNYTYQSGPWSGPILTRRDAPDPAYGPETVELSNGRLVANPLATTLRFAFPTRTDGQFRLSPYHAWNIRVARRFVLRHLRFEGGVDVVNVTNSGADQELLPGGHQTFSANFGQGTSRQLPRSAQCWLKVGF